MSNNQTLYERMLVQVNLGEYWAREKWLMGNYPYRHAITSAPRLTLITEHKGIGGTTSASPVGPSEWNDEDTRTMLMWDHRFDYTDFGFIKEAEKLKMMLWLPEEEDKEATDWVQVNHRSTPTGFFFLEEYKQFKDPVSLQELIHELSWTVFGSPTSARIRLYWSQGVLNKILEARMDGSTTLMKKYPLENNNYQGLISNMVKVLGTWEDGSALTPSEMRHITVLI
jgi:hypothetical protein